MKHTQESLKAIGNTPATGSGNFMSQVNQTINNLKELVKMYQSIQTVDINQTRDNMALDSPPVKHKELPPPPPDPAVVAVTGIARLLDIAIQNGHGDRTLKEVLDLAGPLTVKQLRGLIK